MNFAKKVVIVTGGSSGIGAELVKSLAKLGANVVFSGRNEENLRAVEKYCIENDQVDPKQVTWLSGDIVHESNQKQIIDRAVEKYGKIDVLINNAGMTFGGPIEQVDLKDHYDRLLDVNLKSVISLTKLAIPYLKLTKGNVVNVSSVAAIRPIYAMTMYCVSKAALETFTKCLAFELASECIRINAVRVGPIPTNINRYVKADATLKHLFKKEDIEKIKRETPMGRKGQSTEVVKIILVLASNDQSSYVTGSIFDVDGGIGLAGVKLN